MMMFVVRRLQELGQASNTSLQMYFSDLTKVYDTVDRVLLWKGLARFGALPRIIKDISMFHDGMRARVHLDDGDVSAWSMSAKVFGKDVCCHRFCSTSSLRRSS